MDSMTLTSEWTLKARDLANALSRLDPIIHDHPPALPASVEMTVDPGEAHLRLRIANRAVGGEITMPCAANGPAALTLPAAYLKDIVQALHGDLTMTWKDGRVRLQAGTCVITVNTTELALPAPDSVTEGTGVSAQVEPQALLACLQQVSHCLTRRDGEDSVFRGVLVEQDQARLRVVGTDRYRLMTAWMPVQWDGAFTLPDRTAILPPPTVRTLIKILEDVSERQAPANPVTLTFKAAGLIVQAGTWRLQSQYMAGQYPNWRTVLSDDQINPEKARVIWLDRGDLIAAVRQIAVLVDRDRAVMDCRWFPGMLVLQARGELGEAIVQTTTQDDGNEATMCLNPLYVLEMLEVFRSDQIYVSWPKAPNLVRPVVFGGLNDQALGVIMPIRPSRD